MMGLILCASVTSGPATYARRVVVWPIMPAELNLSASLRAISTFASLSMMSAEFSANILYSHVVLAISASIVCTCMRK